MGHRDLFETQLSPAQALHVTHFSFTNTTNVWCTGRSIRQISPNLAKSRKNPKRPCALCPPPLPLRGAARPVAQCWWAGGGPPASHGTVVAHTDTHLLDPEVVRLVLPRVPRLLLPKPAVRLLLLARDKEVAVLLPPKPHVDVQPLIHKALDGERRPVRVPQHLPDAVVQRERGGEPLALALAEGAPGAGGQDGQLAVVPCDRFVQLYDARVHLELAKPTVDASNVAAGGDQGVIHVGVDVIPFGGPPSQQHGVVVKVCAQQGGCDESTADMQPWGGLQFSSRHQPPRRGRGVREGGGGGSRKFFSILGAHFILSILNIHKWG